MITNPQESVNPSVGPVDKGPETVVSIAVPKPDEQASTEVPAIDNNIIIKQELNFKKIDIEGGKLLLNKIRDERFSPLGETFRLALVEIPQAEKEIAEMRSALVAKEADYQAKLARLSSLLEKGPIISKLDSLFPDKQSNPMEPIDPTPSEKK